MNRKMTEERGDGLQAHDTKRRTPDRGFRRRLLAAATVGMAGIVVGLGFAMGLFSREVSQVGPQLKGDQWLVGTDEFQDGKARHFHHALADGTLVRFFVLRSPDGVLRAALDACEVCWREGKGYVQDGSFMLCRNCGRRFAAEQIGQYRGGCNPHPLPYQLQGQTLTIRLQDLQEGARYFRPTGGGRT